MATGPKRGWVARGTLDIFAENAGRCCIWTSAAGRGNTIGVNAITADSADGDNAARVAKQRLVPVTMLTPEKSDFEFAKGTRNRNTRLASS